MTSPSLPTPLMEKAAVARRGALQVTLRGCVQGIGLRPAIARLADELGLGGCVSNQSFGVAIHVEGPDVRLEQFLERLATDLRKLARGADLQQEPAQQRNETSFRIAPSAAPGPLSTTVPRDAGVCASCLGDVFATDDRRSRYPFTTCTACGPRYSLIEAMPWERSQSSMQVFAMCPDCRREFESPQDRRFHAQTNACPACGPHVWLTDGYGARIAHADDAVRQAAAAVQAGQILAIKGLGGYQLVCDATSEPAVRELRLRKRRLSKPLAVMVEDVWQAGSLAELSDADATVLLERANPILLLRRNPGSRLAAAISPGLDTVGLMLPTTPLHALLLRHTRSPLVVTSGNREGEPLEYEPRGARARLSDIADVTLHHDRAIIRPIDDSVVRRIAGRPVTIRCARGLAPWPLPISTPHQVLAVGGHQKAAVAITNGAQAVLGPHIGDLSSMASRKRLVAEASRLLALYGARPELVVHDLHPDYFTTSFAREFGVPTLAAQHHHAHVAAGMLEHGWSSRTVLGVAFDGTGYGTDGSMWGGEFLVASLGGFERAAHLRPFRLPGGEAAVREPWRVAVSLVEDALDHRAAEALGELGLDWPLAGQVRSLLARPRLSPSTTSVGRLFDGVATLVLGLSEAAYEGEPAMQLEAAADRNAVGLIEIPVTHDQPFQLDWRPLVRAVLSELAAGTAPGVISMRFHRGLAQAIADVAARFCDLPVVLAGGVFQNALLTELCADMLCDRSQPVGLPGSIPPNDGGLAAGQLAIGIHFLENGRS